MEGFLSCPECGYENLQGSIHCKRCLLVFAKFEKKNLQKSNSVIGSTGLETLWQGLLSDYDNKDLHEKFIGQALKEKNLPFASQQYRKMKELNPADEIAAKMIEKIIQIATLTYVQHAPRPKQAKVASWMTRAIMFFVLMIVLLVIVEALRH